jgi:CheY-like chemotaxis protein
MQRPRRHDLALIAQKDTGFVMLSVADTGQGINPEEQERIFEPFFTTKTDGTGLGLATVYGIVTQHGGVVEVDSTPGQGTTFSLYFPQVEEEESSTSLQENDPAVMVGGTETILVVDDSPELIDLLVEILAPLGYHLLGANSPQEAIRVSAAMTGTIDLLLTDVVMPEMNGVELARIIAGQRPSIKMIFLSGYAENYLGLADRPKEALFLEKPVLPTTLASKVREVLDGRGVASV